MQRRCLLVAAGLWGAVGAAAQPTSKVLAVEQPTTFELVINPKAARAQDVVMQSLLLRADEVMQ